MIDPKWTRYDEATQGVGALHEAIKGGRIDRAAGVIKGVKLMGLDSKNGRRYRVPEASLFEGVPIRIDHHGKEGGPELPTDPSFKGIWATTENVKTSAEGVFGDLRYNPKHPWMETILWWAENTPGIGGFSPVTWGMHSDIGGETVIEIMKVESVDLVDRPATTNSFYEQEKTMDPKEVQKIQESLAAKTLEATNLAAKLQEAETKLAAETKRANEAEGKLAAEAAAKLAAERRGSREKLITDADLPADIVTDKFKEAVVNAADEATATLLVETVKRAHGSPRSSTTTPDDAAGNVAPAKSVESFDAAKAAGLLSYDKGSV